MSDLKTILLIGDEEHTREFLGVNLSRHGFRVVTSPIGNEAIDAAKRLLPTIILLDIVIPEVHGLDTCLRLRALEQLNDTAIAFLSCRSEDIVQITGFEAGADDYIKKPVRLDVLIYRLNALARRVERNKIS